MVIFDKNIIAFGGFGRFYSGKFTSFCPLKIPSPLLAAYCGLFYPKNQFFPLFCVS